MTGKLGKTAGQLPPPIEEEASDTFVQRLYGEWSPNDQAEFETRLESDPAYADSYRRVEQSWASLDTHAEAPEVMAYREEAIIHARRANARRWLKSSSYTRSRRSIAAAIAGFALLIAAAWQLSPYGYTPGQYRTGIGEQRMVELEDHSHIALDAVTRLEVRFTKDARIVRLKEGQVQFSVAKDPSRPFKVVAGDRTIIAVGTLFTVEYIDQKVHVAMMEGQVAVISEQANSALFGSPRSDLNVSQTPASGSSSKLTSSFRSAQGDTIELSAGEELHISRDGHSTVTPKADIEAATAWREGKVIIRTESLGEAVQRLNRYSRLQIKIDDDALANKHISGVFEAGDTQGFVSAVQRYLPITADYSDSNTVRLKMR
jgi:transmembrane sensor